jgi:hypothetical protein
MACQNNKSVNSGNELSATTQDTTTIVTSVFDVSSTQAFIDSYTKKRKEINSNVKDFNIKSEIVLSNSNVFIINFSEQLPENTIKYCIAINADRIIIYNLSGTYDDIDQMLLNENVKHCLFVGNMTPTIDLSNDGSPDFILNSEFYYRTSFSNSSRIILYNGNVGLDTTRMVANSDFESGVCDFFVGIKEELKVNTKTHDVTVYRQQNFATNGDCDVQNLIELKYEKVWKFENGKKYLDYFLLNTPQINNSEEFKEIPKKFTFLATENGDYVVKEDCDNPDGGKPRIYEIATEFLKDFDVKSNYLSSESNTEEGYFLAGMKLQEDSSIVLYWLMNYNPDANFAQLEKTNSVNKIVIKKDEDWDDRYWIYWNEADPPALTTIKPENYPFSKCN